MDITATEHAFRLFGVTAVQGQVMIQLLLMGESSCARLGRVLSYDTGAMTRLIDTLDKRGWVERRRSEVDRRIIILRLTDSGRAIAEKLEAAIVSRWKACLWDWSVIEMQQAVLVLRRLESGFNVRK